MLSELRKKISLQATGGRAYTEQINPIGAQSDDYTYVYASISAGYTFRSFLTFSLFYNRQQRLSEAADNSYDTNIFGLSVSTSF